MGTKSVVKKAVISSTFATGIVLTAPLVVDAALGDQPLKKGMSHPDVKELQEVLKTKGYFNYHTATGFYGTITEEAVKQFQKTHGIQTTGVANTNTLNILLNTTTQRSATSTQIASATATNSALAQTTGLLRAGSQGQAVTELQELLKEAGYFNTNPTGYYGRVTESAVREYQKKNRLTVDGIVGQQTRSHLLGGTAQSSTAPAPTQPAASTQAAPAPSSNTNTTTENTTVQFNAQTLRVGSRGTQVRQLQQSLKQLGHFNHTVTDYFGSVTDAAVRSFQISQRLTVDGIAGPQTFRALEAALSGSAQGTEQTVQNQTQTKAETTTAPKNTASENSNPPAEQGFQPMNLVADAAQLTGVPYLWGGTTPSGFDCSGFVQYVFKQQGVNLPRTVAQQWSAGKSVDKPSVGDLVFFETISKGPSHNGIYIGNNQFIHSGSSTGVTVASMNNSYWAPRYLGAKRME
ncbi:peptidoglycan-binding protein [Alkalihalobacterium alkalinitrilicum]|uniref:C40 family peptidase n=1 Tax=Alkalihalobacterium alkalinitrilicum TaxID=427920 RepID=UPI0009959C6A|nr:peptidoglycan-binding protein [Alkalihalobacterium alkalinitrilicum]